MGEQLHQNLLVLSPGRDAYCLECPEKRANDYEMKGPINAFQVARVWVFSTPPAHYGL